MAGQRSDFWGKLALVAACLGLPAYVLFRTCVFQLFNVPSTSMEPSLLIGDYFLVNKSAYGYTHYSLPFSPRLFAGRLFAAEPRRGDLVIFRLPRDDAVDYIKRVVGLPGERIQMRGGALYINGAAVKRERVADFDHALAGRTTRVKHWRETLPNGVSYETLDTQDNGTLDDTPEFTVPTGRYFVLGDNRDNSVDSRMAKDVGYVPAENLIGRVALIVYSVDPDGRPRTERIGLRPQ